MRCPGLHLAIGAIKVPYVRILRLTNSNDFTKDIPDERRSYRVVEQALAEASGEPVETVRKVIWPSGDLPAIVERWIEEYHPDIVFLMVNPYWFNYESVPLKLQRKFGPIGRLFGDMGLRAADTSWLAHNAAFRRLRYWAQTTIGGETPFTTAHVLENMEAVIRRILRHEDVHLVVRTSQGGKERPDLPPKVRMRHYARRIEVAEGMGRICDSLNVTRMAGNTFRKFDRELRSGDGLHRNADGHAASGAKEAAFMVAFWQSLHEAEPAPAASDR